MTEKRFEFKRFYVDIANINEIALYEIDNNPHDDLDDNNLFYVYSTTDANVQSIVDKLNSQEELIKRLKTIREEQIETILEHKRKMQELEERNKRQYNRLKELTELMYERQWGKLENMVEEWEKADELLQAERGTYCGDK